MITTLTATQLYESRLQPTSGLYRYDSDCNDLDESINPDGAGCAPLTTTVDSSMMQNQCTYQAEDIWCKVVMAMAMVTAFVNVTSPRLC